LSSWDDKGIGGGGMNPWEKYLAALCKPIIKLAKLDFLFPDGSVWFTLDNHEKRGAFLQDGALSVSLNNGMRRTASVVLANEGGAFDFEPGKLWFGQQVRLSLGLVLPDGTEFYKRQGDFYVKEPEGTFKPSEKKIHLNLVDKWAYLDGSLHGYLESIYEVPVNSHIFSAIRTVLAFDRGNGQPVDGVPPLFTHFYNDKTVRLTDGRVIPRLNTPYTARMDGLTDTYAGIILEMNAMLAGMVGYNAFGQLQLDPSQDDISDSHKPVLWAFDTDEPEFLGASYTMHNSQVFNDVLVTGATVNGFTARGRATNRNIRSPFNVETIGLKTKPRSETTSDQYVSNEQCEDLARWHLKMDTAMKQSVAINCTQLFHLHENGLVTLRRPDRGLEPERHLIMGYSLPMGMGNMVIDAVSVNDLPFM
jgi:hypothetical protein